MDEETSLLVELMLQAEMFCASVEALGKKSLCFDDMYPLSLKISQCRGVLAYLQDKYDNDQLAVYDPAICQDFRVLVMSLLWVNFLGRELIDFRLFRKLVQIESGLTYVLITRRSGKAKSQGEA